MPQLEFRSIDCLANFNGNKLLVCLIRGRGLLWAWMMWFPFGGVTVSQEQVNSTPSTAPTPSSTKITVADLAEQKRWAELANTLSARNVNDSQADGMTALHWSSFHGNAELLKRLLEVGADINVVNDYSVSPLSIAAERGHGPIVKILVAAGARIESARLGGETPLMLASRNGSRSAVRELIRGGANIDATEVKGQTAMMWAAAAGNLEAVDELLAARADFRRQLSKSGFSAIMFAARNGRRDVVMRLIDAGCDVNAVIRPKRTSGRNPRQGMSALLLAVESGHLELALELVKRSADPNDQRSGFAPLHALTWVRRTKRGDDPEGDPPPRITGRIHTLEFARQLVALGAKVNLQLEKGASRGKARLNTKGATPFLLAAAAADIPYMKLLIELGADPELTNVDGCDALMAAAGVGVVAVGEYPGTKQEVQAAIRLLSKAGLDPNRVDKNGETAMHGAAYRNYPSAVRLLGELGARPVVWNQKNRHGWTPRMIAQGNRPGSVKPSPPTIRALDELLHRQRP